MEFLETFGIRPSYLDEPLGLIRPDLERANAGALPALLAPFLGETGAINRDVLKKIRNVTDSYENIVFIMADGVGAEHLERIGGYLWENVQTHGTVAYSVFPTMTSTNLTSMAYGTLPACHGMVGYNIYSERLNTLFNSLNGKYPKGKSSASIFEHATVADYIRGTPLPMQIADQFTIKLLIPSQLPPEGLPDIIGQGTDRLSYTDLEEALQKAVGVIRNGPVFLGIYLGMADHLGHRHGPESNEYVHAIHAINQFVKNLVATLAGTSTLILLTSDHGQSQLDLKQCRFMNRAEWAEHKARGVTLGTSGRVIHSYADDPDRSLRVLEQLANGRGLILTGNEALDLMGAKVCGDNFLKRVGSHVLMFEDGYIHDVPEVVELEHYDTPHKGQHGSLSTKEIFVPVGIWYA
ncbi:MAG: hypothetical protein D6732_16795 [Methanobacteriota archaeon]|nr:MAG: hypothetical protein D6732_16795 [Euryarchaeota archaeon]